MGLSDIITKIFKKEKPIMDRNLEGIAVKASLQNIFPIASYDDVEIAGMKYEDIEDTEALRRAIHTISNYYNVLGVFRDDFSKSENDRLARNPYYAICEKAIADYLQTIEYKVIDKFGDHVEPAEDFLECPNPQDDFTDILKPTVRDLIRYDAGVWVKSFNKAGYLTELKSYLGTEFWKELDRVPIGYTIPYTEANIGKQPLSWWSHGYTKRFWQRSQTGLYIPYHPEEITYFMMYPRSDHIYGTDFLKFLRYHIQYLIDSTRAAGMTFKNGIIPSLIWEHPDIQTREQLYERILQAESDSKGSYKFGNILHTVGGEKITPVENTLIDMQWLEGQKFVAEFIWAMWGFDSNEFVGEGGNRATAYIRRNITKSRMLKPLLDYITIKINKEVLPYLKGYKKDWKFVFIREVDLDDELRAAQIANTKAVTVSTYIGLGFPTGLALRLANVGDDLTTEEIEELDDILFQTDIFATEELDEGRYGELSEGYVEDSLNVERGGAINAPQKFGEEDEAQFRKSRIYVQSPDEVPEGRSLRRGSRGGLYYVAQTDASDRRDQQARRHLGAKRRDKERRGWGAGGGGGGVKNIKPKHGIKRNIIILTGEDVRIIIDEDTGKVKRTDNEKSKKIVEELKHGNYRENLKRIVDKYNLKVSG